MSAEIPKNKLTKKQQSTSSLKVQQEPILLPTLWFDNWGSNPSQDTKKGIVGVDIYKNKQPTMISEIGMPEPFLNYSTYCTVNTNRSQCKKEYCTIFDICIIKTDRR